MPSEADILTAVRDLADAQHDARVAERAASEAARVQNAAERTWADARDKVRVASQRLGDLIAEIRPTDPGIGYTDPIQLLHRSAGRL